MRTALIAATTFFTGVLLTTPGLASASPAVTVGPGTAISTPLPCTVGFVWPGGRALTAGHCMLGAGTDVYSGIRHVGKFVQRGAGDWALIQLDADVLISHTTPDGHEISSIAAVSPAVGSSISKYGSATHTTSGVVTDVSASTITASLCAFAGDSGGPAYIGSELVGVVSEFGVGSARLANVTGL